MNLFLRILLVWLKSKLKPRRGPFDEVITRFPAEELLVAGAPFVTVGGQLPLVRETESAPNPEVREMVARAARAEAQAVGAKV